ncbi:MAG: TfoX/Sxy family protein [Alphaproteobacteria bacterium]|nr:TfoX/Sxy family protein [Alphaproteobacteria bacterium]
MSRKPKGPSAEDQAAAELAHELFSDLGPIRMRRMFGGAGLYCGELFFAIILDGVLYLKGDGDSADDYRAAGSEAFTWHNPKTGKDVTMNFFTLPEDAVDDADRALDWGRVALAAAMRAGLKNGGR